MRRGSALGRSVERGVEQALERLDGERGGVGKRSLPAPLRQFLPLRAAGNQTPQRSQPWPDILIGNLGDWNHIFIELGMVFDDGTDGQQIRHTHHRLGEAADVAREHRNTMEERFDDHSRTRLRPQRRDQHHARPLEDSGDVVHWIENRYVRSAPKLFQVRRVRAPAWHGGELNAGHGLGHGEKDRDSLGGGGIHHGHEFVVESPAGRPPPRLQQRDGDVHGLRAAILADVVGDVMADADERIGETQRSGLRGAGEGAVGTEWQRQRGARQVHDARTVVSKRGLQQQLSGIVGGGDDDIGSEGGELSREVRA